MVNKDGFYAFTKTSINANTVTLTITDGGDGDNDGVKDGNISDTVGIATPVGAPIAWGNGKIAALFANYGTGNGIWSNDGNSWQQLTDWQPIQMIGNGSTSLGSSFNNYGSGNGVWKYRNGSWTRLTDWMPSDANP